jgi:predicted nucleic acid-binding protein
MTPKQNLVLVDTSVWIDFFRGTTQELIRLGLSTLIDSNQVVLSDIILHEVLIGAKTEEEYQELEAMMNILTCYRIQEEELADFNRFSFFVKKKGLAGSYTDLSIAFLCHHHNLWLYSLDKYFKKLENLKLIRCFHP